MEEEKKENGISTIEPLNCCKKIQMALNECQAENEKLRTELTSCKRSIFELEEKGSNADDIQELRAIEEAKCKSLKLSKVNDELFKQKAMFEQCKGYLNSAEEHAIYLKYKLTISENTNVRLKSDLSQFRNALTKESERAEIVKKNHARITQKISAEKDSLESRLAQYTDAYRELTIAHTTLENTMKMVQFLHQQKIDDLKTQLDIAREIPEFPRIEKKQKKKESAGCRPASIKTDLTKTKEQPKANVSLASTRLTQIKEQPKANVSLASAGLTEIKEQPKANVSLASAGLTEIKEHPKANVSLASADLTEIKEQPKANVSLASAGLTEIKEQPKANVSLASTSLTKIKEQPKANVSLASAGLSEPKLDSNLSVEIHLEKNQPKQSEELTHIRHKRLRRRANKKAYKLSARLQREALLGELVKMKNVGGGDGSAGEVDSNRKIGKKKRFCRQRQNKKVQSKETN